MKSMKIAFISLSILVLCGVLIRADRFFAQTGNQKSNEPLDPISSQQAKERQASAESGVIGYLESRDRVVTMLQGPKGPVYTIKTKDGKTLATKINDKSLQAKYPELYDQIKNGLAGNDATLRKFAPQPVPAPSR